MLTFQIMREGSEEWTDAGMLYISAIPVEHGAVYPPVAKLAALTLLEAAGVGMYARPATEYDQPPAQFVRVCIGDIVSGRELLMMTVEHAKQELMQ